MGKKPKDRKKKAKPPGKSWCSYDAPDAERKVWHAQERELTRHCEYCRVVYEYTRRSNDCPLCGRGVEYNETTYE